MKMTHYLKTIFVLAFVFATFSTNQVSAQSVSANESLNISIKGVPPAEQQSVSGMYNVSSKGYISLPMLPKPIKASGTTLANLAKRIEAAYKAEKIYKDPRITIISQQDDQQKREREVQVVSIGGYVRSPGQRPYRSGMTLYQAVAAAGGPTAFGSIRRVALIRGSHKTIYDLRKTKNKNVKVRPGDTIDVPQTDWKGQ